MSGLRPKPQAVRRNVTVASTEDWIRSWDCRSLSSPSFYQKVKRRELTWSWSVYVAFHLNEVLQTWARFLPRKMGRKDIPGRGRRKSKMANER